jgi:hypothetical protein
MGFLMIFLGLVLWAVIKLGLGFWFGGFYLTADVKQARWLFYG